MERIVGGYPTYHTIYTTKEVVMFEYFRLLFSHDLRHAYKVWVAWNAMYGSPTWREKICILIHDIGYVFISPQNEWKHPYLGAVIAGLLFGKEYFLLCAGHSREYSSKTGIQVSRLCAPDKASRK